MKKEDFRLLAEDVAHCHICERLVTVPHLQNSERLENDDHGLGTDNPYVNLWNLWQGNLDAEIMVIGQDYGTKEEGNVLESRKYADMMNPTDRRLKRLFKKAFGIDLDSGEATLFFTNTANCYRKQRTSGGAHSAWLPICANKFMARLIRIIRPKIVVVLGKAAFEALHCMEDLPLICCNPADKGTDSFSEALRHRYQIDLGGTPIEVFPVYHPGTNSQMNRTEAQQLEDWKRIAQYYQGIKENG